VALCANPAWADEKEHATAATPHKEHGKHPVNIEKKLEKKADPLEHVMDSHHWHFFETAGEGWHLPKILGFQITKFMILEVIAALLIAAIYIPMARRRLRDPLTKGAWDNTFEVLLTFVRDQIAQPSLAAPEGHGEHGHGHEEEGHGHGHDDHGPAERNDYDRFVPFLWTLFLFILFNNLLGLFPFGGSATASVYVTGALALVVFFAIHGSAVAKMGLVPYLKSLWPHIDVPFPMGYLITPLVFLIEIIGALVRNAVLAVRLFANMFAGHTVLAVILGFIIVAKGLIPALWATISVSSVVGVVALSLLEIFVAFLQAYIFVFLTALFMGMALHPQH
jgi:F-type H+-transporting ATPase subunit a